MRRTALVVITCVVAASSSRSSWASPPQDVTIATIRYRGSPGTFTATGAIADSGSFSTLDLHFGGIGAPDFLLVHATLLFEGSEGSFTLKMQLKESATSDPNVLSGHGTWEVISGTGAYADLHAGGTVDGITDETVEPALFDRTYTGSAHFD